MPDSTFHVKDEIYLMNGFERGKVHPLLMLDKHPNDKTSGEYPIAWCKEYGKGRVFYCSLGHSDATYWNADVLKHYLAGLQYVLGDLPADATPSATADQKK